MLEGAGDVVQERVALDLEEDRDHALGIRRLAGDLGTEVLGHDLPRDQCERRLDAAGLMVARVGLYDLGERIADRRLALGLSDRGRRIGDALRVDAPERCRTGGPGDRAVRRGVDLAVHRDPARDPARLQRLDRDDADDLAVARVLVAGAELDVRLDVRLGVDERLRVSGSGVRGPAEEIVGVD